MRRLGVLFTILTLFTACGDGPLFEINDFQDKFDAVTYNNKVDILWVIDSTPSMAEDRQKLTGQIELMIQKMDQKKLDYRMAAVTMDMGSSSNPEYSDGRFIGSQKIIDTNTHNKAEAFKSMLNVPQAGTQFAEGLGAMKKSMSEERVLAGNANFFRDGSLLAVIFVSDDRDWSDDEPEDYIAWLDSVKPNLENGNKGWVANFIGVIEDSNECRTLGRVSMVGSQFMALANESGGSINSICSDVLATTVGNIQRTIINIVTDWHLDEKPVIETIKVSINGVEIPQDTENGWTYNPEKRLISFHGSAIPASDAEVVVDYKPESLGLED